MPVMLQFFAKMTHGKKNLMSSFDMMRANHPGSDRIFHRARHRIAVNPFTECGEAHYPAAR
jgi:hypothetical protein